MRRGVVGVVVGTVGGGGSGREGEGMVRLGVLGLSTAGVRRRRDEGWLPWWRRRREDLRE